MEIGNLKGRKVATIFGHSMFSPKIERVELENKPSIGKKDLYSKFEGKIIQGISMCFFNSFFTLIFGH